MPFNPNDPFAPKWYHDLMDSYESTADRQTKTDEVIAEGFKIPDTDGSRNSLITKEAILNNTFDYDILIESLNEIYHNSSNRLKAANNDNVNFFQWHGKLSDMDFIPGTDICEFKIPHNAFITPMERELFKQSPLYKKWIKVEDILNNWKIFKWHLMLFINYRTYSEYEIQIDEQQVWIRFRYYEIWKLKDLPVSIYKFDTNYQKRILISRELCENQWNWKLPFSYVGNEVSKYEFVMCAINKISDSKYRKDGLTRIDVLGDNLEFLPVKDNYIDLSRISKFNKDYIRSELTEYLWMSITVPKFMHEYPVLLPTDVVHRPYPADIKPVVALRSDIPQNVYTGALEKDRQVYIDVNGKIFDPYNGWLNLIRPIVLSDAYKAPLVEPLEGLIDETRNIRDLTTVAADTVEVFRQYIETSMNVEKEKVIEFCDRLVKNIDDIQNALYAFYDKRLAERDTVFTYIAENQFKHAIEDIREKGIESVWINPEAKWDLHLWEVVSPLIWIPRELIMKYSVVETIYGMRRKFLYDDHDKKLNKVRFQRPVDESNFWTFEYDPKAAAWRPYPLKISHHFPDAYILKDPNDLKVTPGRVFKAFIFYSDTINTTALTRELEKPTPQWDENVFNFYNSARGAYTDIFMEKFYWMGLETLHKNIRMTDNKWELIEYIIDNEWYTRFNDLFLKTADPYFKLGLATYIRSKNFEFPFDYAIEKFQEAIESNWDSSKKITNFELYLNNQWIPSYFDSLVKILDDFDADSRIVRRPPVSFDIKKVYKVLIEINTAIRNSTQMVLDDIDRVLKKLENETYRLKVKLIVDMRNSIFEILNHLNGMLDYISNLDMQVYSIEDLKDIINKIHRHHELMTEITDLLYRVKEDVYLNNIYHSKRELIYQLEDIIESLPEKIEKFRKIINSYKIHEFMLAVNDLRTYLDGRMFNPDDKSLIAEVNEFNFTWNNEVKSARNNLFISTTRLYSSYDERKSYSNEEVEDFVKCVESVKSDLDIFQSRLERFYLIKAIPPHDELDAKLDTVKNMIQEFNEVLMRYYPLRRDLLEQIVVATKLMSLLDQYRFGHSEREFYDEIINNFNTMLYSLSYLAGVQKVQEANDSYNRITSYIQRWFEFINVEEEVFQILLSIVKLPSPFLVAMENRRNILLALIEYIDGIMAKHIPDIKAPNLSEVFEIREIEILNQGFFYEVGESLYFPDLGSYKVTEVDGELSRATAIELNPFRLTTFRDPMSQLNPYFCVSDKNGIGVMVRALSSRQRNIIDDNAAKNTINRINSICSSIHKFISTSNPYNNAEFKVVIASINRTNEKWSKLLSSYKNHLTTGTKTKLSNAIEYLLSAIPYCEEFITERSKISLSFLTNSIDKINERLFKYAENNHFNNEDFYIYQNRVIEANNEIERFYGDGRSWYDKDKLISLLSNIKSQLDLYERHVFITWPDTRVAEFLSEIEFIKSECDKIHMILLDLNIRSLQIAPIITNAASISASFDDVILYKDTWYRFSATNVANRGHGYEPGDIISIIPELPKLSILQENNSISPIGISTNTSELDHQGGNVDVSIQLASERDILVPSAITPTNSEINATDQNVNLTVEFIPSTEQMYPSQIEADNLFLPDTGGTVNLSVTFKDSIDGIAMNDTILFQVMETDENGGILAVTPLLDYAIPYLVWGYRETITHVGKGTGASLDLSSKEITYEDSLLINGITPVIPQFGNNDLFAFKFENIHDLNLSYEVFIAGKQITHYFQRHETVRKNGVPNKLDVIYVNANQVMALKNASVYIPAEEYFVYRINNISIIDPGRGYAEGQDVFVDVGEFALRLKVTKLLYSPYKEIADVGLADGKLVYEKVNPGKIGAFALSDDFCNIDDEYSDSIYDNIPREGVSKPIDPYYPHIKFIATKDDLRDQGSRNAFYTHKIARNNKFPKGDPDGKWLLGSEIPREPIENRTTNLVSPLHPLIQDYLRIPHAVYPFTQYHLFGWERFHNSQEYSIAANPSNLLFNGGESSISIRRNLKYQPIEGDLTVATFKDLPQHSKDWPDVKIGSTVIVENDETCNNRRMKYRVRTFYVTGYLVYNLPEYADYKHNTIEVDWMNTTWYSDQPCLKQQYSGEHWRTAKSFREIQEGIFDKRYERTFPLPVQIKNTSYIDKMTTDDLNVYNITLKRWENLQDSSRWKLEVIHDDENKTWGFKLIFLQEGFYDYDFKLYWNKTPANQLRNAILKRKSEFNIESIIVDDISTDAMELPSNLGKTVRIRKLFPYYQKQSYIIGKDSNNDLIGYDMNFKLAKYIHYRNQLHLADVKLYNKTLERFEDVLDPALFEVRFKSDYNISTGSKEIHTTIERVIVSSPGEGFTDGPAWGYNEDYDIHLFGVITARLDEYGPMLTFKPTHCNKMPKENTMLEFMVYQHEMQTKNHAGAVILQFKTQEVEVWTDGYIHNVTNPMAPLPEEFKIISLSDLDSEYAYDIIINKSPETWEFIEPRWIMTPTFKIPNTNIHQDRLYIITDKGRFPLRNPSTGYPTMRVRETEDGTNVTFLNIYRKMERLQIHSTPYPMRSVYVQRRIPKHGYLDLSGKLNKPLSKKHYEFWMNGRLLDQEVNIITPSKIIFHGLKSLRNFEIIEINRDQNEYFSDLFLELGKNDKERISPKWNFTTYLDRALTGDLENNFTLEEQAELLYPVWPQVPVDDPEYKNYPPNFDLEEDIIQRIHTVNDLPIMDIEASSYQFLLLDLPTLEGVVVAGRNNFNQFGLTPITDDELMDMLNEEWAEEIRTHPKLYQHIVISDDEWYGMAAKMYDAKGIETVNPDEALYKVYPLDLININTSRKRTRIIRKKYPEYNFE